MGKNKREHEESAGAFVTEMGLMFSNEELELRKPKWIIYTSYSNAVKMMNEVDELIRQKIVKDQITFWEEDNPLIDQYAEPIVKKPAHIPPKYKGYFNKRKRY